MVRKKSVVTASKKRESESKPVSKKSGLFDYFRFGESYTSLILGMVVVILAVILVTALFRNRDFSNLINFGSKQDISSTNTQSNPTEQPGTHVVKAGENLWTISELAYKSGYNWVDIAKENNIVNPDAIEAGQTLKLPEVTSKIATVSEAPAEVREGVNDTGNTITGNTYTVQSGDYLWEIAVRAYGDGYRWVQIAKDNNIQNPDIIYSGTVLRLSKT